MEDELTIGTRAGGGEAGEIDRRRHNESVVVVGVLANKIDAARGAEKFRRTAE